MSALLNHFLDCPLPTRPWLKFWHDSNCVNLIINQTNVNNLARRCILPVCVWTGFSSAPQATVRGQQKGQLQERCKGPAAPPVLRISLSCKIWGPSVGSHCHLVRDMCTAAKPERLPGIGDEWNGVSWTVVSTRGSDSSNWSFEACKFSRNGKWTHV